MQGKVKISLIFIALLGLSPAVFATETTGATEVVAEKNTQTQEDSEESKAGFFTFDTLSEKNVALYEQFKKEKSEREIEQKNFLAKLLDYFTKHNNDIEYRPFGVPFSSQGIFVLDNMVVETDIGSIQVFKEGYLPKLFAKFEQQLETFEDMKSSKSYPDIIAEFKENQIASFLFGKNADIRLFFEKMKRNASNQQRLLGEVNKLRWVKKELDKMAEERREINVFLTNITSLEEQRFKKIQEEVAKEASKKAETTNTSTDATHNEDKAKEKSSDHKKSEQQANDGDKAQVEHKIENEKSLTETDEAKQEVKEVKKETKNTAKKAKPKAETKNQKE